MKITKSKLIELIREELENILEEEETLEEAGGGYSVIEMPSGKTVLANVSCQAAQRKRNDLNKKASGTGKSYRMKPGGRCK